MANRSGGVIGRSVLIVSLLLYAVPIYWLVKSAFSTYLDLTSSPPQMFPPDPSFSALWAMGIELGPSLVVSAIVSLGCTVITLGLAASTAYGLTLLRGRLSSAMSTIVILGSLMFPSIAFVVPLFTVFAQLHILNTIFGLILADCIYGVPLGILLCYTYFRSIPTEIMEAALMDGSRPFSTFVRIACPIAAPALATTAIFAFLFGWGDYLFAVTFGAGRGQSTAPVALASLIQSTSGVTPWDQVMAGAVIISLPGLAAILFAQRFITSGIAEGAVK